MAWFTPNYAFILDRRNHLDMFTYLSGTNISEKQIVVSVQVRKKY
jgi:hypothetical protein